VSAGEGKALPEGEWAEHGFSPGQQSELRDAIHDGIKEKAVPGCALMIIHKGEVIFREAHGLANIADNRPFTVDDVCFIASLTKPFTATVLAILADRGLLSLEDRTDEYLPEFGSMAVRGGGPARAPTIKELLSHTAGFPSNNDFRAGKLTVKLNGTLAETVADLARQELFTELGTHHAYTRLGFMTAARVAEVVSGKDFETLMRDILLDPIGAENTGFHLSREMREKLVTPYVVTKTGFNQREGPPEGQVINPGGGLYATLDDVGRLLLLHRNRGVVDGKRVVSAEMLEEMYMPQPATPGQGYGLGLNVLRQDPDGRGSWVRHTGGSGTLLWIELDADLLVVFLSQVPTRQMVEFRRTLGRKISEIFALSSS
jgi:CubicO group peptidase (beta-lactamase class C family)